MKSTKKVSIILINWNQWRESLDCIDSIFSSIENNLFEIILVDNGSTDGSIEMIEEMYSNKITIIRNDFNNMFAPANNQAYNIARGEIIWVLNTDTIIQNDCLTPMLEFLAKNDDYWAVTCKLLNKDLSTQYYIHRRFPSFLRLVFGLLYKRFNVLKLRPVVEYLYLDKTFDEDFDIEQAGWACILVKRELLDTIGWLFDEKNFALFYNDVDLCYRVWKSGSKIRFLSSASLVHLKWQSTGKLNFFWSKVHLATSGLLFFRKHALYLDYILWKFAYICLFLWLFVYSIILVVFWKLPFIELRARAYIIYQIIIT